MSSNFNTTTRLAKYIADFTYRADGLFNVDINSCGNLWNLDYECNPHGFGYFNGIITYSIFKTSFEITIKFPDHNDHSNMSVIINSNKTGVNKHIYTTRELKAELKIMAEKLTEFIGSEGSEAFKDLI